ncbi:MAG TPA: DUF2199 domain-containing protein [Kiloniellales bacterium]
MDLSQWDWICACCGERKRGIPDYGFDAPIHHHWAQTGDPEFKVLTKDSDTCVMEIAGQPGYFIRCVLRIPVQGLAGGFGIGIWASLSEASFRRYAATFADADQSRIGSMFGYLANRLPAYPDTLNLKADVLPQDGNQRPLLRLWDEAAGHPLYADQTEGIDTARLIALLGEIMPCSGRA